MLVMLVRSLLWICEDFVIFMYVYVYKYIFNYYLLYIFKWIYIFIYIYILLIIYYRLDVININKQDIIMKHKINGQSYIIISISHKTTQYSKSVS